MAQRGRPKKIFTEEKNNFLTEEKNLKIDNSLTLQPGRYKASELHPIVLKLHARGVV